MEVRYQPRPACLSDSMSAASEFLWRGHVQKACQQSATWLLPSPHAFSSLGTCTSLSVGQAAPACIVPITASSRYPLLCLSCFFLSQHGFPAVVSLVESPWKCSLALSICIKWYDSIISLMTSITGKGSYDLLLSFHSFSNASTRMLYFMGCHPKAASITVTYAAIPFALCNEFSTVTALEPSAKYTYCISGHAWSNLSRQALLLSTIDIVRVSPRTNNSLMAPTNGWPSGPYATHNAEYWIYNAKICSKSCGCLFLAPFLIQQARGLMSSCCFGKPCALRRRCVPS